MSPTSLTNLLTGLGAAADVVEAIDDPTVQRLRGWDLHGWRYDLVPWGVRFTYHDASREAPVEIIAVIAAAAPPRLRPDAAVLRAV